MTKKVVPYLLIIFVSLLFQNLYGQVNPADSNLNNSNRIGVQQKEDSIESNKQDSANADLALSLLQPKKLRNFTIRNRIYIGIRDVAERSGFNTVAGGLYNFFDYHYKWRPQDTLKVFHHSPKKAAWMSAIIPGLGQFYNRKYWKLPIIYVGFGVFGYLGYYFHTNADKYKSSYLVRSGFDSTQTDYYPEIGSSEILYSNFSYYRRNFELTCIFGSLFYVLNIIDASVDAHLYKFDISDDLSMRIEPEIINYSYALHNNPSTGIKISLHF
jgi:hypothetical protein